MSAEDYPYDPTMTLEQVYKAEGLEKLRGIPDRSMARNLYELFLQSEKNERDPRFQARERSAEATKKREPEDHRRNCTASCLDGVFGKRAQQVAEMYTQHGGDMSPEACEEVFRQVVDIPWNDRQRSKESRFGK